MSVPRSAAWATAIGVVVLLGAAWFLMAVALPPHQKGPAGSTVPSGRPSFYSTGYECPLNTQHPDAAQRQEFSSRCFAPHPTR